MKDKKRVAVLTTYYANFGSYFQATALQNQIEKLGYDCELINEKARLFKSYKMLISVVLTPILPNMVKEFIAGKVPQYYAYLRLRNDVKQLKTSSAFDINIKKLSKKYDCIVVGSDELWSANKKTIVYYPHYFGIDIECPHITYGPSATMFESASVSRMNEICYGLKTFDKISVRDIFTYDFVKKLTNIEPQLVIDPTIMNPYFAKKGEGGGEYILVYGQHYSQEEIDIIKQFANNNSWKVMSVAWNHEWCDGYIDTMSAEEMQAAFNKSEYCFPSTFHGVIFSILNQRNFTAFINPLRGRKVKMLLETFQLESRIYSKDNNKCFDEIDFVEINKILSTKREESINYLKNALYEVCNG